VNDFTQLVDLASERLGGRVLAANDEFFAPKENLLKEAEPVFVEHKYTNRGKWMDGWETRRRREPGFDWCIVQLGLPGVVRGIVVDTSYFRGNFPEHCSIEACSLPSQMTAKQLLGPKTRWTEILAKSALQGDTRNPLAVANPRRFTHLRLKIYPDGGVARLRVHGEVAPDWGPLLAKRGEIDLAAVEHGGRIIASSDQFFGSPKNLLLPGRARNMGDGWETQRRRGPGFDWVVVQLGTAGTIRRAEVDTLHFKGNFPESCSLEACHAGTSAAEDLRTASLPWKEILPRTRMRSNARHVFRKELRSDGEATHVRFNIYPDGGVARLRIFGVASPPADAEEGLARLNAMPEKKARAAMLACCGSRAWAERMAAGRPFSSAAELLESAEQIWSGLGKKELLAVFRHHPRIGQKKAAAKQSAKARRWSATEQSTAAKAPPELLAELAKANRAYEARFGYIFLVSAAGRSSEEILTMLRQRLGNDAEMELGIAAEEQRKITRRRLEDLIRR
jgi:allantoicase